MVLSNTQWLANPGKEAYEIDYSCRFNDNDSANLEWAGGTVDNADIGTISVWVKRGNLGLTNTRIWCHKGSAVELELIINSSDKLLINGDAGSGTSSISSQVLRDPHAWYHIVTTVDTSQATAADRIKVYVNNVQITVWDSETWPTQNDDIFITDSNFALGYLIGSSFYWDGYCSEFVYIDGQALPPSSFGETDDDGVWRPIDVSGLTFGTSGFYLDFADDSALGNDVSGNNNDFTSAGLADVDQMIDTPTNNFATLSSIQDVWGAAVTLSNGNLSAAGSGAVVWNNVKASIQNLTSGKWIFASRPNVVGAGQCDIFVINESFPLSSDTSPKLSDDAWACTFDTATNFIVGNQTAEITYTQEANYAYPDLLLLALDIDNSKAWFGKYDDSTGNTEWTGDGTNLWDGDPAAGTGNIIDLTGSEFTIGISSYTARSGDVDFGQRNGEMLSDPDITIPSGFKFLNTTNLAAPAIVDPSTNFQTAKVTHNGTTANVTCNWDMDVTDTIIIAKNRDSTEIWYMADGLQGYNKYNQFSTTTQSDDSDVFSVSETTLTMGSTFLADDYIVYFFKTGAAGGESNGDGSVTTTVAANTTAGISIVIAPSGTNASKTFGHGLGVTPTAMWVKPNTGASNWSSWWSGLAGATYDLNITSSAVQGANDVYASQAPTTYGSGSWTGLNVELSNYCFTDIPGFLKAGVFEGNGDPNGPLIITGFKPALVIIASIDSGSPFAVYDNLREGYNVDNDRLDLTTTGAEGTADEIDLLSNGFKLRIATDPNVAETSIFIAIAENPFGGFDGTFGASGGVSPATAR